MLVQLSNCTGMMCSLSSEDMAPARRLPLAHRDLEDIAALSDDAFVVVERHFSSLMGVDVARVSAGGDEPIASIPPLLLADLGPSLIAREGRVWFSRLGELNGVSTLFFLVSGDHPQLTKLTVAREHPPVWLPIRGDDPRGLLVSIGDEQPALHIDEVTVAGVKPLAALSWWGTGINYTQLHPSRWSAQPLADGRFAVLAVDGPPEDMSLRLRVLGSGVPTEATLSCGVAIDLPLSTAVNVDGRLAIVGVSKAHQVVAVMVDADRPQSAVCRVISDPGESAAGAFFGTPSVVSTAQGFVAAWISDDGRVRACELRNLRLPPVIVNVGEGAEGRYPLRQLVHTDGEYVRFIWKDQGGGIVSRRMPTGLTGFALALEVQRLCVAFHKAMDNL